MSNIRFGMGIMVAAVIVAVLSPTRILAEKWEIINDSRWCDRGDRDFCEIREITLDARKTLSVDGANNGGISVEGWDKNEIRVQARITVDTHGDEERAERIGKGIEIDTDGTIVASGKHENKWSVSYRIMVPNKTNLELEAYNGGVSVTEVKGTMRIETHNGGLSLSNLAGDVRARTTNGGLSVQLSGREWDGAGLDVRSTNGGIELAIPRDYNAELRTGTVNGGMRIDFPITVQGTLTKKIEATLGNGGAPIRVTTTNGGVSIYHD